ncbi:hypothetical protein ACGFZB_28765 [Streptomyces cinerochromogenes]|uniref:Uncharacterized protein n=1 Tax=Streptomyces cinerochromogenes TaxID=66422 RepID=A0ABW7BAW4_9ACTN
MGVFDGGTYRVSIRWKSGGEDDEYTSDPHTMLENLRADPEVAAVETCWVHYVTGERESEFCFGDFWGDGGDEDEDE